MSDSNPFGRLPASVKPCLCIVLVLLAIICTLSLWHSRTASVVDFGQTVGEIREGTTYALSSDPTAAPHAHYEAHVIDADSDLALLILRASNGSVDWSNQDGHSSIAFGEYERARIVDLGETSPAGELTFSLSLTSKLFTASAYLGSQATIEGYLSTYSAANMAGLVAYIIMLLYALSLLFFKRNEPYLKLFVVYLIIVISIYVVRAYGLGPQSNRAYALSSIFLQGGKVASTVYICWLLVRGPGKRPIRMWQTVLVGLLVLVVFALVCSEVGSGLLAEALLFPLYLTSFCILVRACAAKVPGAYFLLVGWTVTSVLALLNTLIGYKLVSEWLVVELFFNSGLRDLFFTVFCMFFINQRFAGNYELVEKLTVELQSYNASLDRLVAERTSQYLEEREQRQNMMSNVFHDLRSPLFAIKGCADMMQPHNQEDEDLLQIIRSRSDFMGELTENLFTLAQLESGSLSVDGFSRVNVTRVLENVCDAGAVTALASDVKIQLEKTDIPLRVWGDSRKIEQIFQNILQNAVRHAPQGSCVLVKACITTSEEPDVLPSCAIAFTDQGPGIEPQDLEHIFKRYYQAGYTGKRGSAGLGLSIAKNLVELHHGTLTVKSEPGHGATFTVQLPLTEEPDDHAGDYSTRDATA